ncbi:MAG: alpha-L-glutamate ligase-like protein [Pseudomonadales bacterium]|nr:alpha-L-glutamate ligase-like protein [Pseudomonadales bacterium]
MFLANPRKLREMGILGMNGRNFSYIARHNPRHLYPLVDNKLKFKLLAQKAGIAVPELLGTVSEQHDIKKLRSMLAPHAQFVIKPAKGSGGKGILVINEQRHDLYFKPSEEALTNAQIELHVSNILSGLYSLGGTPDVAMIEAMVQLDPVFTNYSYEGIPDLRVILFRGYPVMAMLRLATHVSDGKANLHQGAVGVGIDLATGTALRAVQFNRPVSKHPDTGYAFTELTIPHWNNILPLAASCYEHTSLGYLGADIVLDKNLGPLIIELNARPGLSIQVANGTGLGNRLKKINTIANPSQSPEERSKISQEIF